MLSWARRRFTYSNIALTLALVFAMTGGAYAANKIIITSTKQISPKVLKALQGKSGAPGAAGSQGLAGPAGKDGINGTNGTNGKDGAPGENVTSVALPKGDVKCAEGGSKFTVGGKETFACTGSPWPAGGTLPSGKSEQGVWSVIYTAGAANQFGSAYISFGIPLAKAPQAKLAQNFIGEEEGEGEAKEKTSAIPAHCKGTVAKPEALPGNVCVFATKLVNTTLGPLGALFLDPQDGTAESAGKAGTAMDVGSTAAGLVFADGTWVVTAE